MRQAFACRASLVSGMRVGLPQFCEEPLLLEQILLHLQGKISKLFKTSVHSFFSKRRPKYVVTKEMVFVETLLFPSNLPACLWVDHSLE